MRVGDKGKRNRNRNRIEDERGGKDIGKWTRRDEMR